MHEHSGIACTLSYRSAPPDRCIDKLSYHFAAVQLQGVLAKAELDRGDVASPGSCAPGREAAMAPSVEPLPRVVPGMATAAAPISAWSSSFTGAVTALSLSMALEYTRLAMSPTCTLRPAHSHCALPPPTQPSLLHIFCRLSHAGWTSEPIEV